jgi:hypothetical protein
VDFGTIENNHGVTSSVELFNGARSHAVKSRGIRWVAIIEAGQGRQSLDFLHNSPQFSGCTCLERLSSDTVFQRQLKVLQK